MVIYFLKYIKIVADNGVGREYLRAVLRYEIILFGGSR